MKKLIFNISTFAFIALILGVSVRGLAGNPSAENLNDSKWKEEGPLELSPERGRFALTYSLMEDKSFSYSLPIARFATPDLGFIDGRYVSLFAPGISFLIIPGYLLGSLLGASQVGAFAAIAVFALFNAALIKLIATRLGASSLSATLGAITFIFATPAFAYAVTLYQHHVSTFLILLSIYALLRWNNFWSLFLVWFLAALSLSIDYPNFFLMFPIGLLALAKTISIKKENSRVEVSLNFVKILTLVAVVIPMVFFLWFNKNSYGNPLQLAGTVKSVKSIDENGKPAEDKNTNEVTVGGDTQEDKKTSIGFFQTRNLLNGFYIHFLSPDRGIVVYTPVILLAVVGGTLAYKQKSRVLSALVAVVGANMLLYSMWGDPYGGWSFGSRYLIPSFAILSIFIALALEGLKKNIVFLLVFSVLFIYSAAVNTLGAITTNTNPPKVEAIALEQISGREEKYTFLRNWQYLNNGKSKSFVFQSLASRYVNSTAYYFGLLSIIVLVAGSLLTASYLKKEDTK